MGMNTNDYDASSDSTPDAPVTRGAVSAVGPRDSLHSADGAGQMVGPADANGATPNVNTEDHNSSGIELNH